MKNKTIKYVSKVLMCAFLINVIPIQKPLALTVTEGNRLLGATPNEWESSNLREWLNTDKATVDYTGLPPSYKNEAGFLSTNNFTTSEQNGIAITRHSGGYIQTLSGNINKTSYISQRSLARNDYIYNDKVFILNYTDLVNFLERNKQLMNENTKYYSDYLKRTTNKQDKYSYIVNTGGVNTVYSNWNNMYSSTISTIYGRNQNNIVPALSLKPDYTLSNGVEAKDLKVGQSVTFGKYNGENIEWKVINKNDNGYPLLWSTKIITTKEYDKEGDINPTKSNYINFSSYDVDLVTGTGQNKSWETQTAITSYPVITITNESVLTTPTNDTQITINIKVTDTNNTIRNITLPDGRIVNGDTATFTINQNGEYDIISENSQGIITVRHIVTKAINTPAEVTITTDKDNSTKWSNRPVNVTVSATNNGIYTRTSPEKTTGYSGISSSTYPSWMPLGAKRIRVTGTLYNKITDADITDYSLNMNANIILRLVYQKYTVNALSNTYPQLKSISLKDLKTAGQISIDEIYTIPNDVYGNFYLQFNLMNGYSDYMRTGYNWGISSFTYEILDKDDLKIEEISLPDGNKVYSDTATYIIYKNGSYTFSAKDNRNKVTSKTIDLAIDMVYPTLNITPSETKLTKELVLKVDANDDLSGVRSIKLPNGETRSTTGEGQKLSIDYNIVKNGNYIFETTDYAGNITKKTISITNVDNIAPTLNLSYNSNPTNSNITVNISAIDNESGVKNITLPNGNVINGTTGTYVISENGIYSFSALDNNGNITLKYITITNIDRKNPTVIISNDTNWINKDALININATD